MSILAKSFYLNLENKIELQPRKILVQYSNAAAELEWTMIFVYEASGFHLCHELFSFLFR